MHNFNVYFDINPSNIKNYSNIENLLFLSKHAYSHYKNKLDEKSTKIIINSVKLLLSEINKKYKKFSEFYKINKNYKLDLYDIIYDVNDNDLWSFFLLYDSN